MKGVKGFQKGENNPMWVGDDIQYSGLHCWVRNNIEHTGFCSMCGSDENLDLANVSQEYKRDITDWEWLCRRCHMKKDGRMDELNRNKASFLGKTHSKDSIEKMKTISSKRKRDENGRFIRTEVKI
jgi:hypothetical protein